MATRAFNDLTGHRFGRLTVMARDRAPGEKCARWIAKCDCGTTIRTLTGNLNAGHQRSCGCLRSDIRRTKSTTHGLSRSRTYRTWASMMARCRNPKHPKFKHYGGRGISVCARWRDFPAFAADMGSKGAGLSIERIDNNGNYEPENCRWAPMPEQASNKQRTRRVTHGGRTMCLAQWCREVGIGDGTVYSRMKRGQSELQALGLEAR